MMEVSFALIPLLFIFLFFQVVYLKLPMEFVWKVVKGMALAYIGLILFLHGVKIAFLPVGTATGELMGVMENNWILIPVGFILGFVITIAEPAVRILGLEVEETSSGYIKERVIVYTLGIGVAFFVALGMTKIIYGIPFYYLIIPGYILAIILLKFSDSVFTSIAFDSGGVATGPMTVTFVMAMAIGVAEVMEGRDAVLDGFGIIALVALAPILSVMILGILYRWKEVNEE